MKCGRVGGRERSGRWGPLLLNGTARLMWCSPPLADGLKHVETQGFAPSVLAAAHVRRCQKPPCAKPPRLGSAPARSPPNTTEPWYRAPAAAAARSGAGGTPMGCSQQRTCGVALRTGHAHQQADAVNSTLTTFGVLLAGGGRRRDIRVPGRDQPAALAHHQHILLEQGDLLHHQHILLEQGDLISFSSKIGEKRRR